MARGISLHVGVWDPKVCETHDPVEGPKRDPLDMADIAVQNGFRVSGVLLGDNGTWDNVSAHISAAARELDAGDIFLLSFSGHGDTSPKNGQIQTWCLADDEVTDSMILDALGAFRPDVRVLVVSGSCHSGGLNAGVGKEVVRVLRRMRRALAKLTGINGNNDPEVCNLTPHSGRLPFEGEAPPSMLFLAACGLKELALDGDPNTLFTEMLLKEARQGRFSSSYHDLMNRVSGAVSGRNPEQHPTCAWAGTFPKWRNDPAFVIDVPAPLDKEEELTPLPATRRRSRSPARTGGRR